MLFLAATAPAWGHHPSGQIDFGPQAQYAAASEDSETRAAIAACEGDPPMPPLDYEFTGGFTKAQEGSYVLVPFEVPAGIDAIRYRYCFDQPELSGEGNNHTIDSGLYAPPGGDGLWDEEEFRGWGGSSRRDVTVSAEASLQDVIRDDRPADGTESTTVGFRPGPIKPGKWAVELGVAAVAPELPVEDGGVQWRLEIALIDDPSYSDRPWEPIPYDSAAADRDAGWYAGDFHVHARNSNPGDASMPETFSYAFCPDPGIRAELCGDERAKPGAGLDFITLSDYVSDRHWGEIGAFQRDYPGHLVIRSSEIITYRGHVNNHASLRYTDYRTGPIYRLEADGSLELLRQAADYPVRKIFRRIHAAGGWTQINHPQTFPSEIPLFGNLCRGCSWSYSGEETDYSQVDAIEVATGPAGLQEGPEPGPNPFTPLAISFYERAIDSGGTNANHIAAVGASDSHNAGRSENPLTQSPIGQATTVVYAPELSEAGIRRGVRAGHTYAKMWGNDGPDLRLEATEGSGAGAMAAGGPAGADAEPKIFGDTIRAERVSFVAEVRHLERAQDARPGAYTLFVLRNGRPFEARSIPAAEDRFTHRFESTRPGRYGLQVERTASGVASVEAYSTPIWHEPAGGPGGRCANVVRGTGGPDELRGTKGSDELRARGGPDSLRGLAGSDCLRGGPGRDRIRAGGGPRDRVLGGRGRDRVWSRDGNRDFVRCGRGRDRAKADGRDRLFSCERRRR